MTRFVTAAAVLALSAGLAQADYTLHILHTNDMHSRIESINRFDSTCDAEGEAEGKCFGGVARVKAAIDAKRAELGGNRDRLKNGLNKSGGPPCFNFSGSSGKARFNASLTPKAIQFSNTIPPAVGTAPFHNADIPSLRIILVVDVITPLN